MTLRVAQFSLKIAHLSFSMVLRGPRARGLRPRLWLLVLGKACVVSHPRPQGYPVLNVTSIFPLTKWIGGSGDEDALSDALLPGTTIFPLTKRIGGSGDEDGVKPNGPSSYRAEGDFKGAD